MNKFIFALSLTLLSTSTLAASAEPTTANPDAQGSSYFTTRNVVTGLAVVTSVATLTFLMKPNLRKSAHQTFVRMWSGLAAQIGFSSYINLDAFANVTNKEYAQMERLLRAQDVSGAQNFIASLFSQGRAFNAVEIGEFFTRLGQFGLSRESFAEIAKTAGYAIVNKGAVADLIDGGMMDEFRVIRLGE